MVAAFLLAYVVLDWVSYLYPVSPLAITVWNPPPGLALALLLLFGLEFAPAVFAAALVADIVVRGAPGPIWFAVGSALVIAAGYTLVAALLLKVAHFDPSLRRARDVVLLLTSALAGAGLVAATSMALNVLAGLVATQDFARYAVRAWIGDAIGVAVTTPFILIHAARSGRHRLPVPPRAVEGLVQLASLAAALLLVLWWAHPAEAALFYVLFVPVVWVAMRRGLRGVTTALMLVQIVLIGVLWAMGNPFETVLQFQVLMLALAGTALLLAVTVDEQAGTRQRLLESEERLKEQQDELSRALRLAAAGEMTSALAHELHQPLSAIASYAKACQLLADSGDKVRLEGTLRRMGVEIGRASDLVRRLRDFFRTGTARLERFSVADLVRDALESSRARLTRHQIELVTRVADPAPFVLGDRVQLTVVIQNLVGNSIDALTRAGTRRREVSVSAVRCGSEVELVVRDSGPGVPAELMATLFTPFASSKPDGMGLGLSICRHIAEAHGGRLWAEPLPAGTAFHVALPVDEAGGTSHESA